MTSYLSHEVNTYTIEVSLLGYEDLDSRQIVPYTDDLYGKVIQLCHESASVCDRSVGTSCGPSGTTTRLWPSSHWRSSSL